MISEKCNFKDFLEAVKDTSGFETIHLTHEEATQAERLCYKIGATAKKEDNFCCGTYSEKLKAFILYLRHGVQPRCIKNDDLEGFERIF
jgi:hypothetical protein